MLGTGEKVEFNLSGFRKAVVYKDTSYRGILVEVWKFDGYDSKILSQDETIEMLKNLGKWEILNESIKNLGFVK